MNAQLLVEPLGPVKAWLRTQSITGVGARVYIGDPTNATLPYVSLTLVDAPVDPGEVPVCHARVQCCAQGSTEQEAADAIFSLLTKCRELQPETALSADLDCMGADVVLGPVPRVDDLGPRYLADIRFSVVAR